MFCDYLHFISMICLFIFPFCTYDTVGNNNNNCHQNNSIESVFIEIDKTQLGKDKNVIIGVVYRPPNGDISLFNTYMSELLSKIKSERKYVSCLGDYNISSLNYDTHGPTQEFADLMYSYSLFPCITKPTRVTAKSASLIDNIFCNNDLNDDNGFTGILYTDISDHFPIFILIAHLPRKQLFHILKNVVFPSKILNNFLQIYATEIGLICYHTMIRTLHIMCS